MIIDLIYVILLAVFLFRGFRKGLVIALISWVAVMVGILGALKLSGTIAGWLFDTHPGAARWAPLITYILVFFLLACLVRLIGNVLQKSLEMVALGWLNRLTGALLYGFVISIIFSSVLWILDRMQFFRPQTLAQSSVFPVLEPVAPRIFSFIGDLVPYAKTAFSDLSHFFEQVNQKLPDHVGAD